MNLRIQDLQERRAAQGKPFFSHKISNESLRSNQPIRLTQADGHYRRVLFSKAKKYYAVIVTEAKSLAVESRVILLDIPANRTKVTNAGHARR